MPAPGWKLKMKISTPTAKAVSRKTQPASSHSASETLRKLGLAKENPGAFCGDWLGSGNSLESLSPIDGRALATVRTATPEDYERTVQRAQHAFKTWHTV